MSCRCDGNHSALHRIMDSLGNMLSFPGPFDTLPEMITVAELKRIPKDQRIPFESVFIIRNSSVKRAKNNSEFLMVELGDRTGLFHTVCFENSVNHQIFSDLSPGAIVRVQGQTGYYNNRFSPNIEMVSVVPEDQRDALAANLVESAVEDIEKMWSELKSHIEGISHQGLKQTTEIALSELEDVFKEMPGAISMHHAYRGGLLEHTLHMARAARALFPCYPEVHPSLVMAGIILHDIGKCLEYTGPMATRKTADGILQGHVVLGYRLVRRAALQAKLEQDLRDRLEHIILSHQGELEWGAAAKAATPEAVFVSMVDNLDAKMGMVQQALRITAEGEPFSETIPGLGAPVLVLPIQDGAEFEANPDGEDPD